MYILKFLKPIFQNLKPLPFYPFDGAWEAFDRILWYSPEAVIESAPHAFLLGIFWPLLSAYTNRELQLLQNQEDQGNLVQRSRSYGHLGQRIKGSNVCQNVPGI